MNFAILNGAVLNGPIAMSAEDVPAVTGDAPSALDTVYCTDEDIAAIEERDFFPLCPKWQQRAFGADGGITGGSFTLRSTSVDFSSCGVQPRNVVRLTKRGASVFPPEGALFAVHTVDNDVLILRRIGEALGVGRPPVATTTTGITFEVRTFARQIDDASYEINQTYGIDPAVAVVAPASLYDPRELLRCTVLMVLVSAYTAADKTASGDFDLKRKLYAEQLSNVQSRLQLRWNSWLGGRVSSRFGMRVSR